MKPRSDKPLPHIPKHRSEISNTRVHNSRLAVAVNRVIPDILYSIFVLAVYDSTYPVKTTLNISHVCDHWRKSVLGWPTLWAFVDSSATALILDMFMNRSGNAPLTLSWSYRHRHILTDFLEPRANLILPRLFSLTLHFSKHYQLSRIHHVLLRSSKELLLQLRHLEIHMRTSFIPEQTAPPPSALEDLLRIDLSCLRVLELKRLDLPLPWLDLPNTKLTHFTLINPPKPPALSRLLEFLSRCPLLCNLEFHTSDFYDVGVPVDIAAATTESITGLDFSYLRRLVLKSDGPSSCSYIRELSTRVQSVTLLSEFCLLYYHHRRSGYRQFQSTTDVIAPPLHVLNIFEAIPSGVLSCFTSHHYLYIDIDFEAGFFRISSAPDRIWRSGYPLDVSGSLPSGPASFDHLTPILDLIHSMPRITQLELGSQAWKVPWIIDIPSSFPCLDTLGLKVYHWWTRENPTSPLNSIPAGLKLRKLILTHSRILKKSSVNALLRAVTRTGVEYVDLLELYVHDERSTGESRHIRRAETVLRKTGVILFRGSKN